MIKLKNLMPHKKEVNIFAKLEGQNPGGSIKDRAALYMIEQAEQRGELDKNKIIIEATSGNMGISLAMVGAQKGYKVKIVMSEAMSKERKTMLRALGAELILTDKNLGTKGAIDKVKELIKEQPRLYWFADQFNNQDNVLAHYYGIASEILKEVKPIDVFVAGVGTGGTIMGIAKKFKEDSPMTKIFSVVPPSGYLIQGIQDPQKDFIGNIYNQDLVDENFYVSAEDSFEMAKIIAKTEGLFGGMSSGAILYAAKKIAESMDSGNIVVIIPDRGEKYLSTDLFR